MNNSILEAIKKKAEDSWEETTKHFENGVNPDAFVLGFKSCGSLIIGFVEWVEETYARVYSEELKKSAWIDCKEESVLVNGSDYHYTTLVKEKGISTEELLSKYMENEKKSAISSDTK